MEGMIGSNKSLKLLFFQTMFGPSVLDRTMVIMSHADAVFKDKSIDEYLAAEGEQPDSHLFNFIVRDAGRRVVAISNLTENWPSYKTERQRLTVLNCIMQMVKRGDDAYTNDIFLEAQELRSNARRNFQNERKELLARNHVLADENSSSKIKALDSRLTTTEREVAIERIKASSKFARDLNTDIICTIFEVFESTVTWWIENGEVSRNDYLLLKANILSPKLKKKVDKVIRTLTDAEQKYYQEHEREIRKAFLKYIFENENYLRELVAKNQKLLKCFPAASTVLAEGRGLVRMDALEVGDRVLTVSKDGTVSFEDIFFFSHLDKHTRNIFLLVTTETGEQITISPLHLIPVKTGDSPSMFSLIPSGELRPGDTVFIAQTKTHPPSLGIAKVSSITTVVREGLYCPHTSSGSVFVDNVLSSCYTTVVPARLAHALLRPVYWLYQWLPTRCFNWLVRYDEVTGIPGILTYVRKLFVVGYSHVTN